MKKLAMEENNSQDKKSIKDLGEFKKQGKALDKYTPTKKASLEPTKERYVADEIEYEEPVIYIDIPNIDDILNK